MITKIFKKKFEQSYVDILIATYNRLEYLKKTIWSLIASEAQSEFVFRIWVMDDKSTDGTGIWLDDLEKRKVIYKVIRVKSKLGTANSYNVLHGCIEDANQWFVITNDDMWFLNGWFNAAAETAIRYDDCGIVNLYDYTALSVKGNSSIVDKNHWKVKVTGLGAVLMNNELYNKVDGFSLPSNKYMGYFASSFCKIAFKTILPRRFIYQVVPNVVLNMDRESSKLKETLKEYVEFRRQHKK